MGSPKRESPPVKCRAASSLSFMAACGLGAVANVGIASYLFASQTQWVVAALAGIAVGAVWNYAITQLYTWGQDRSRDRH